MSKLSLSIFLQKYQGCTKCELHKCRTNIVFARGTIPCDVCFIGEAPGRSEDDLKEPFVGPAGHLLNQIIEEAIPTDIDYSLTNVVMCIPLSPTGELEKPDYDHVMACSERLKDFIELANPRLIVCVGEVAFEYLDPTYSNRIRFHKEIPIVEILHPSYIISRMKEIARPNAIRRCVETIQEAIQEYLK